ncbi:helix-turn-helix transcriptional regulator [Thaumasiovibrio subtropicus]|uniref:helix-turn-helix transcriptional regulator n=1 Tax=Thaumasiovibrio subtropicus TaxID=1891207 RepID=UPI000B362E1A|nr:metalloregulator ArsR/SmtB family transcription factor [Thaumasiovibrio subtropicus]
MKTVDKILQRLKKFGSATAKELADEFSMTTMGARQHLQGLEQEGLITFFDERVKVGRPTRHWKLSALGHQHFADRHADLSIQLIEAMENTLDQAAMSAVIRAREENSFKHYQTSLNSVTTIKEKLEKLTTLREQEGYMAELLDADDGDFLLVENHCPICRAATKSQTLCQSELQIFRRLLGTQCTVDRTEHIIAGQRRCAYRITVND